MRTTTLAVTLAAGMLTALGCAQVPDEEVRAAKSAMEGARNAEAQGYAADSWSAAVDTEARLDAELAAQDRRSSWMRSYQKAKTLAEDTKEAANRAMSAAATGKQKAKDEVVTLMAEARTEHDAASNDLATAPKGKGTAADLASLKADAVPIDTTLAEMQQAFDSGDYVTAKTKAQSVIDASKRIRQEIEQAKAARHSS